MQRIVRTLVIVFFAVGLVAGGIWVYQTRIAAQPATSSANGLLTQTVAVQQGNLTASISVVGELAATQQQDMLFDRVSGTTSLMTLQVAAGNTVKAGQTLATIDPSPYQQALDQAQSELESAQQALTDLQTPPTDLDIAQADLAVAQAQLDLQQAEKTLADLQGPDLTDLQVAVQNAQDSLQLAQLQQTQAQHDNLAGSERDLQYAVDWHQRKIYQLQDLVAHGKANLEQTQQLTDEETALSDSQVQLAQVQAQRQANLRAAADKITADQAALVTARQNLADAKVGGTAVEQATDKVAVEQARVSLQSAQDARTQLDQGPDAATLAADQAAVDQAQLAVTNAQTDLAGATLVAPFDGTVLATNAVPGDRITASSIILTVANLSQLQVVASIDETTIRQVSVGQAATITFDAFPGQTFQGQVLSIPMQGALQGGVMIYEVPISLEGADKLPLLVGMTANVTIQTGQVQNGLLVPTIALQNLSGLYQVLVPSSTPGARPWRCRSRSDSAMALTPRSPKA